MTKKKANGEKLIKSKQRVKDFAEVYTPSWLVKDMCDLVKDECERIDSRFLEPACGNGNFLVEIAARKFAVCKTPKDGLKALTSIVGIDIQADNCRESRERLLNLYKEAFPTANAFCLMLAEQILQNNIICGDSLKIMAGWAEENEKEAEK